MPTIESIDGYYLDSIMLGDRDVLGKEVLVTEGMPPFRIVYKPNSAGIRGKVEDCGGASVLLLPQQEDLWNFRFLHQVACDRGGRFEVAGLRPGPWYRAGARPHRFHRPRRSRHSAPPGRYGGNRAGRRGSRCHHRSQGPALARIAKWDRPSISAACRFAGENHRPHQAPVDPTGSILKWKCRHPFPAAVC